MTILPFVMEKGDHPHPGERRRDRCRWIRTAGCTMSRFMECVCGATVRKRPPSWHNSLYQEICEFTRFGDVHDDITILALRRSA